MDLNIPSTLFPHSPPWEFISSPIFPPPTEHLSFNNDQLLAILTLSSLSAG